MRAASAAGVCLAALFIPYGTRAQETKEKVTVNEADRTYLVRLPRGFDRVNHDKLMGQIAKRVEDKRLLKLIRAFLNAGVMENGLVSPSVEGTPQGVPLSSQLSNLVLDELDREGTSLCSLCGRQQHLRSQRARGPTGDGKHPAIHHAKAQTQGE